LFNFLPVQNGWLGDLELAPHLRHLVWGTEWERVRMDIAESVTYDFARNRSFSPGISYPLGGKPSSSFEANKLESMQEAFR